MEKIDLTKCINCRFRAVVDGKEVTGRIEKLKTGFLLTGDDAFGCVVSYLELAIMRGGTDLIIDDGNFRISGFEIVLRDPETYKDWQVGDIIWDSHESGDNGRIIFRSGDFVAADIDGCRCYTCGELYDDGYRLVLTDIEQQIIGEKKKYEPQEGDIVAWQTKESQVGWAISIYEKKKNSYMTLFTTGICGVNEYPLSMEVIRPATDEEKQRLFDAMAKDGKRWNAEKKVVEDIPKPYEFKKGEPVLVRTASGNNWRIAVFSRKRDFVGDFEVIFGNGCGYYDYCLPYNERTMHLLGTTEDYNEE